MVGDVGFEFDARRVGPEFDLDLGEDFAVDEIGDDKHA